MYQDFNSKNKRKYKRRRNLINVFDEPKRSIELKKLDRYIKSDIDTFENEWHLKKKTIEDLYYNIIGIKNIVSYLKIYFGEHLELTEKSSSLNEKLNIDKLTDKQINIKDRILQKIIIEKFQSNESLTKAFLKSKFEGIDNNSKIHREIVRKFKLRVFEYYSEKKEILAYYEKNGNYELLNEVLNQISDDNNYDIIFKVNKFKRLSGGDYNFEHTEEKTKRGRVIKNSNEILNIKTTVTDDDFENLFTNPDFILETTDESEDYNIAKFNEYDFNYNYNMFYKRYSEFKDLPFSEIFNADEGTHILHFILNKKHDGLSLNNHYKPNFQQLMISFLTDCYDREIDIEKNITRKLINNMTNTRFNYDDLVDIIDARESIMNSKKVFTSEERKKAYEVYNPSYGTIKMNANTFFNLAFDLTNTKKGKVKVTRIESTNTLGGFINDKFSIDLTEEINTYFKDLFNNDDEQ